MDTLLKAAEERGFEVLSKPHVYERITLIQILGQVFDVKLYEPLLQKARIPTEEDRAEIAKWGYSLRRKHDYVESGKLCLQLRPEGAGFMYWEIRDTDRALIDAKLKKFFLAALRRVDESRGWQRERYLRDAEKKEFERRQREEEERHRQIEEARELEQARIDALVRDASRWRQSREIREYLIEVLRTCAEGGQAIEPGSQLQRWLTWADETVVQLNPLSRLTAGAGANRKDTP